MPIHALSVLGLTERHGYHFTRRHRHPDLLVLGMSAFRAVFFSMGLAVALSFVRTETALLARRRLFEALQTGGAQRAAGGRRHRDGRHHRRRW